MPPALEAWSLNHWTTKEVPLPPSEGAKEYLPGGLEGKPRVLSSAEHEEVGVGMQGVFWG